MVGQVSPRVIGRGPGKPEDPENGQLPQAVKTAFASAQQVSRRRQCSQSMECRRKNASTRQIQYLTLRWNTRRYRWYVTWPTQRCAWITLPSRP